MSRTRWLGALCAALVLVGGTTAAYAGGGNSDAAHACQHGGYLSMVGADGTTFGSVGACVSYAAHGGSFATGLVIPADRVAVLSNAHWALGPCDRLRYGYQLNMGSLVELASKPVGCFNGPVAGATIGPFPTATLLRIWLNDTGTGLAGSGGSCDFTYFNDGVHALVTGAGPYTVDIRDSFFCQLGPSTPYTPYSPAAAGQGNISLVVTIS